MDGRDKEIMQKNGGLLQYVEQNDELLNEYNRYIFEKLQLDPDQNDLMRYDGDGQLVGIEKGAESEDFCYIPRDTNVQMSAYQANRASRARPSNPYRHDVFC